MDWKSYFQKTVGKAKQRIFREIKLESETPGEAGGDGQRWKLRGKGVDKRLLGQRASGCQPVPQFTAGETWDWSAGGRLQGDAYYLSLGS